MTQAKSQVKIEELKGFSGKDADSIRNLIKQLGSTYQELSDFDLKQMLELKTTHLIVARKAKANKIIGMATLAIYRIPYLRKAYLDDFIIDKDYQGQGIGSKLMQFIINKTKTSDAGYLEFTSNPKRVGANKFYEKQGFVKRDTNVYRLDF